MSRPVLIAAVALAAFALLNIAFSAVLAAAWRLGLTNCVRGTARRRARALVQLRALPTAAALALTVSAIVPAFVMFEPWQASETAGPLLLVLAAVAVTQLALSIAIAIATTVQTSVAARRWLRRGEPLDVNPPAGVPAYAIDSLSPIVALVGVFKPKLVAARSVIAACTADELTTIVAHERGHLHAHDNLKRWLMNCAPDALRWTPVHRDIVAAWDAAAEDAADDAAATSAASRVDLAALLIKIARLAAPPTWPAATVSPFVEPSGLDRRVRRLLTIPGAADQRISVSLPWLLVGSMAAAAIVLRPQTLERLYEATEAIIAFGR
jgi:hypothetical protein